MKDYYHKLLKKLAHFQVKNPYISLLILLLLTIAVSSYISEVRTVASLEQMMPKDVTEIEAFNVLRDNYLGQDMIAVVIEVDSNSQDVNGIFDIRDKRVYDYIKYLETSIKSEPDILETYSYAKIIDWNTQKDELSETEYNTIIRDSNIKTQITDYINDDSDITILLATTDISADDGRMSLLSTKIKEIIDSAGHPPGVQIKLTGTPVIQQKLGVLISKDRNDTKTISTIFVFIITMILFGTFTSAIVPIIIVSISVNWLYGTMGYFGLPISTLAGGVAAMVIGIGIDFAIHIINKFKYEFKKTKSVARSIEAAVVDTGTALTATSLTTIMAFLAFLSGNMPEMGRFGILMAIGITYSLLFTLFGLPALLVVEQRVIVFFKSKMKFGLNSELHLISDKEEQKLKSKKVIVNKSRKVTK